MWGNSSFYKTPYFGLLAEYDLRTQIDSFMYLMENYKIIKPFYVLIQGCAHKDDCPNGYWHRVPSYAESRYQTYYSLTMGVEGIFPWCARSLFQHPNYQHPDSTYDTLMDFNGWQYLRIYQGLSDDSINDFISFFTNEESLVFGNIKTVFLEIEPYTEMFINNDCFDNVFYWQVFNPYIDSIIQDTSQSQRFLKTLFIKDPSSNYFYFIAVNNNNWTQDTINDIIRFQIFRFSFNDTLNNKLITFIRNDPYKYDSSDNFCDLEPADNIVIPTINNIKFYPDNYSGFTHPNEKYLYDYFGPGEVHVYQVSITDYSNPSIENIIYTIDGKYRLDKFQGFDDVNRWDSCPMQDYNGWYYSDLTCGADSNWSTYVNGGPWFNIETGYCLPIGVDNNGNYVAIDGRFRYEHPDVNGFLAVGIDYPGWYFSDLTIYYPETDIQKLGNGGPWHNIDSGYSLPMAVDENGNIYVANAKSRYDDPDIDGFNDIPSWNPSGYQFFSGWYYSDITIYANDTTTYRDIGPWHNQELGLSLPFAVDGQGNLYVVNALGRYNDSLGFKPVDTAGGFPNWYHTDITIYNNTGTIDTILKDIGPWININNGYSLPFSVDKNGNIFVVNGQVKLNQGYDNFDDVNTSGHNNYNGWHYSDIVIYNRSSVLASKLNAGPWHNIDSGYSLPMAVDGDGYIYIANAKSRYDDPDIDGFDDVNTAGHDQFDGWFSSDVTVYNWITGQEVITNRDRGPWHNMELGFSLPMVSTQDYICNVGNKRSEGANIIQRPLVFSISQNYPNPFNSNTTIEYFISRDVGVYINVYNILGQKVKSLISGIQPAGRYSLMWDRTNNHGQIVANGVYFYQLNIDNEDRITRKMLLVK